MSERFKPLTQSEFTALSRKWQLVLGRLRLDGKAMLATMLAGAVPEFDPDHQSLVIGVNPASYRAFARMHAAEAVSHAVFLITGVHCATDFRADPAKSAAEFTDS